MADPEPLDHVVAGAGPGLVLIHGTGADATSNWGALIDAMRDRYTVVAPNLPGAGATPVDPAPTDLDALADRVVATAQAAGLERFHLVGHSLGAAVATAMAARHPAAVTSLVLHAGWVRTTPREAFMFDLWARLLRTDPALLAGQLILTAMGPGLLDTLDDAQFAELTAGFTAMLDERILGQIELDSRIDLRDAVGRITAPTLVLASTDDQIIPTRHQRELAAAIHQADYLQVPGGHGLPFEDPARFFSIIAERVDQRQAQGQS
ncbi:pimeloyl-ACP methyl ester carboxylesterase [Kitasatospora sp. MAP12-15]|uniref:alpha/beta fold hydrolase n=1 Tax=unclassified Kitasatospora TaxID=2633591 RepID=UPI002474CEF2|nr:alpha/beta fold hydrolase [Kitasatospora sp. MAP12-44]MDH6109703.1 pimeloyl-ACP methyl ester carboxylesterase [Kitasatospora sp. MAP12-44]